MFFIDLHGPVFGRASFCRRYRSNAPAGGVGNDDPKRGERLSANPGAASRRAARHRGQPPGSRRRIQTQCGRVDGAHPDARKQSRHAARQRRGDGAEKPADHAHAGHRLRPDRGGGGVVHGLCPMARGGAAGGIVRAAVAGIFLWYWPRRRRWCPMPPSSSPRHG